VIKLEQYFTPEQLRESIEAFVDYYNNRRYHESLDNLTPADVYHSRGERILNLRKEAKKRTIELRRKNYFKQKAKAI
jgi:transposase InsO family protein